MYLCVYGLVSAVTYHIVVSDEVLEGKCCCEANLGLNGVGFGGDNFEKL